MTVKAIANFAGVFVQHPCVIQSWASGVCRSVLWFKKLLPDHKNIKTNLHLGQAYWYKLTQSRVHLVENAKKMAIFVKENVENNRKCPALREAVSYILACYVWPERSALVYYGEREGGRGGGEAGSGAGRGWIVYVNCVTRIDQAIIRFRIAGDGHLRNLKSNL